MSKLVDQDLLENCVEFLMAQAPRQQQAISSVHSFTARRKKLQLVNDIAEDVLDAVTIAADTVEAGSCDTQSISILCTPEYSSISTYANPSFHVRTCLRFTDITEKAKAQKVPVDIVCILDNSLSMNGSKLDSVKEAVKFVIASLNCEDRLAVVYFNRNAGGLHGLLRMTEDNKTRARNAIDRLSVEGGTDIHAGLALGAQIMADRTTRNTSSCIFLLTDGQDSGRAQQKQQLAQSIKTSGSSLFVFGFGADHDSQQMMMIAGAAEGIFTYVDTDDTVIDAFGGAIGTQQGVALRNISLTITCAALGEVIVQTLAGSYVVQTSGDFRSATVQFSSLYSGEFRDVLINLNIPAAAACEAYPVVSVSASYKLTEAGARLEDSPLRAVAAVLCAVPRLTAEHMVYPQVRDVEVDVQVNRQIATQSY